MVCLEPRLFLFKVGSTSHLSKCCLLLIQNKIRSLLLQVGLWCTLFRSTVLLFSSVQSLSRVSLLPHGLQHTRPACPLPTPRVYPNSCPFSWWCHPTISSSVIPVSSCLQSFSASGSYQMTQFFESGQSSIGVSASASVIPMTIQDSFPSGWTGWVSLQSKGLSRVFSNIAVQKHQFFKTQLSL